MKSISILSVLIWTTCGPCHALTTHGSRATALPKGPPPILQQFVSKWLPTPQKFSSILESLALDLPTGVELIGNLGDDELLPSIYYNRYGELIYLKHPRVTNASSISIGASMSGKRITFNISIPHVEFKCVDCIYEIDDSQGSESSRYSLNNITVAVTNLNMILNADLVEKDFDYGDEEGSLALENISTSFVVEEFYSFFANGSQTWENGTVQYFSNYKEDYAEFFRAGYEFYEEVVPYWIGEEYLNCFLGGHTDFLSCMWYFQYQTPYHQGFSQIFHALGLAAARKSPEFNKPIMETTDPIAIMNKLFFQYGTYMIQTAKFFTNWDVDESNLPMDINYESTKTNCSNGGAECDTYMNSIYMNGSDTFVYGLTQIVANCRIRSYLIDYEYRIPNLVLNSKGYLRSSVNQNTGSELIHEGIEISITKARFGFNGYFTSDGNGIIQLHDSDIRLTLDQATAHVPVVTLIENGSRKELQPVTVDIAPDIWKVWRSVDEHGVTLQQRYSKYVEDSINDFLAGRTSI